MGPGVAGGDWKGQSPLGSHRRHDVSCGGCWVCLLKNVKHLQCSSQGQQEVYRRIRSENVQMSSVNFLRLSQIIASHA